MKHSNQTISILSISLLFLVLICCSPEKRSSQGDDNKQVFETEVAAFVIDTLASDLLIPWGMDWLPDGRAIFTERGRGKIHGGISLLNTEDGKITPICGVPLVFRSGDGGLLDILVHPEYKSKPYIYFAYSTMRPDSTSTLAVDRGKIENNCLKDRERLFEVFPYFKSSSHFGCRLLIKDAYLYISMGERYSALDSAQTLTNHFGKIMRLHEDGSVPEDNPFVNIPNVLPEIWSYGHRNPQGMAFHPRSGDLWIHEHGPQGGDEINIVRPGLNYGWPVITYGEEYGGGPIGEGITKKDGMEQPVYHYTPSIAPSGMTFYTGNAFPAWKGNLLIGAMVLQHLNRLVLQGNQIIGEERMLKGQNWRVRLVKQGPDDFIYIGVDNGMILRLRPSI